jgi:predicted Zn finger-like uncharacterized protein
MLIVCPSCTTSYMIEPASLGPAGRNVRCARCRETWFAHPPEPDEPVDAFVDGVIAEAEMAERSPPTWPPAHEPGDFAARADSPRDPYEARTAEPPPPVRLAEAPSLVPPIPERIEPGEPTEPAEAREAGRHAPLQIDHMPLPEPAPTPEEPEAFAVRRRRLHSKREKARRSSRWTAIVLVLLAFNVALVGARSEVVRYLPQTASLFAAIGLPVNLRQLSFEDVRVTRDGQSGTPMLSIEGKIVSKAAKAVEVPRLRFAARNAKGQEIYTWTARPERKTLGPGETLAFRSFAKPPDDAIDIVVRFFNAQDAGGGT